MARSAHAYVRGNTRLFYAWLDGLARGTLPEGPNVWICGDCHLGNLGPLADGDGRVDIQIRDLDQTVIGNPAHDLIRLGLSLASAARGANLPGVVTAHMMDEMVAGYGLGLSDPDPDNLPPEPGVVRTVRRRAIGRHWKHLARERLKDVRPALPLGRKFWALSKEERRGLRDLFEDPALRNLILKLNDRSEDAEIELLDAAYWIKGCSSLGHLRYAALVGIDDGSEKRRIALVDLKEAVEAVAPASPDAAMPRDPAERVVAGALALSPNLGERMLPIRFLGASMVMRELAPQDLKLDVEQFSRDDAVQAAHYLAFVVGQAHGRQMKPSDRRAWREEVTHHRAGVKGASGAEGAPIWLWSSVVDLAGRHESGYLTHCRDLAEAAAPEAAHG